VRELVELIGYGSQDIGVGMADIHDTGSSKKIDIDVSVNIFDCRPLSQTESHGQSPRIRDGRSLTFRLKLEKLFGFRPRRCDLNKGSFRKREFMEVHGLPL
jgi:hypothetical protein